MCLILVCRLHISAGLGLTGTKQAPDYQIAPGLRNPKSGPDYHGIDAEESILTKSLPNLGTWALPNLFFINNDMTIQVLGYMCILY